MLLAFITCTKPASSEPPRANSVTSSEFENVAGPSKHAAISAHHCPCSGRLLLAIAASSDSNRANRIARPSLVTPAVLPRKPAAPGRRSRSHLSIAALIPAMSLARPSIT